MSLPSTTAQIVVKVMPSRAITTNSAFPGPPGFWESLAGKPRVSTESARSRAEDMELAACSLGIPCFDGTEPKRPFAMKVYITPGSLRRNSGATADVSAEAIDPAYNPSGDYLHRNRDKWGACTMKTFILVLATTVTCGALACAQGQPDFSKVEVKTTK